MIKNMNEVKLVGTIYKQPKIINTKTGKLWCVFQLEVQRGESRYRDRPTITCWESVAEVMRGLKQGDTIAVKGIITTRYDDWKKATVVEVLAEKIVLLDAKQNNEETFSLGDGEKFSLDGDGVVTDDDLPY